MKMGFHAVHSVQHVAEAPIPPVEDGCIGLAGDVGGGGAGSAPPGVVVMLITDTVAEKACSYLRALGPRGEASTGTIAQALGVGRPAIIAALMRLHGTQVASRATNSPAGCVLWRLRDEQA